MDYTYCCVSKAPISYGTKVIVIPVAKNRFKKSMREKWLPAMMPIEWEFDSDGWGYEDELSARIARRFKFKTCLIRKEVWDNAHLYWHPENKQNRLNFSQFSFDNELHTASQYKIGNNFKDRKKNIEIEALSRVLNKYSFDLQIVFKDLLFSLPRFTKYEKTEEHGMLYDHPVLFHQIRKLFKKKQFSEKTNDILSRLAIFSSNSLKPLIPVSKIKVNCYPSDKYKKHLAEQWEFEKRLLSR